MPVFTVCIRVRGDLWSSFVFENHSQADEWVTQELPNLVQQYNELEVERDTLPGLRVGDRCNVWGEASDVFVIKDLFQYSPNRWGFLLDKGFSEEVAKCHTKFL
jgi:hypothetical protein